MSSEFPPLHPVEEPVHDHPLCKATMVCLRGPCQHYWSMTQRQKAGGTRIFKKHSQGCVADLSMDLNEENIYHCSKWWPSALSWVPESLRPIFRPRLVKAYELYLKARGYDMSWKDWSDDTFEVGEERRHNLKLRGNDESTGSSPAASAVQEGRRRHSG